MTNAKMFCECFGIYADELWAKPEDEFLKWANAVFVPANTPHTNATRIRQMADEELAEFLYWDADGMGITQEEWLDWLKREVKFD